MRARVPRAFSISNGSNVIKTTSFSLHVSCVSLSLFVCYSLDQERIHSLDSSSSSSSSTSLPSKIENVRCPIKPRTMAQAQIPSEESFLNVTSDADVTLVPECKKNEELINFLNVKI